MAMRQMSKAEKSNRRQAADGKHVGGENVQAGQPQRRVNKPDQEIRVGVAEDAPLREKEDGVCPVSGAREDMVPMFDQRQRDVAVFPIANDLIEAGKKPAMEEDRKAQAK